jgi:glutamate synthase (NADPH/NADH) large chain
VVILGSVGDNFAAGMTGGMAFVYDADEDFEHRINTESVIYRRIETAYWEDLCRGLIAEHRESTQSNWAASILADWEVERVRFWQIVPIEMIDRLENPVTAAEAVAADVSAD